MSIRPLVTIALIMGSLSGVVGGRSLSAATVEEDWVATQSGAQSQGVVTDELGFIYIAGYSNRDADHNFTHDIIVIKYDPDGNEAPRHPPGASVETNRAR